jgi:tRNA (guanine-N7-)-methyltransferase
MTPAQKRALAELLPRRGIEFTHEALDPEAVFGRRAPLVVEIGFGNGDSLVQQAAATPECNFIGIEVHEPGVGHCLLAAERAGADNLRIICHDATEVLREQLPPASVTRLNLYFPDPWPKKRHHKRRILRPAFLDLVDRVLTPDGALHIATDWDDYAEQVGDMLGADPRFTCAEYRRHGGDQPLARPSTKFERRGLRLGHDIHDWRYVRSHARD